MKDGAIVVVDDSCALEPVDGQLFDYCKKHRAEQIVIAQ